MLELQAEHGDFATFLTQMPDGEDEKIKVLKETFKFMGSGVSLGLLESTGLIVPPHHPYCYKVAAVGTAVAGLAVTRAELDR